jgi:ribonuclease R
LTGIVTCPFSVINIHSPIEGKLDRGFEGMDVGQPLRVQLVHTDVQRGYIDFKKI